MKTSAQNLLDRWQRRKALAGIAAGVPWTPSVIARLSKSRSYEGGHRNSNSSSVRSAAFPIGSHQADRVGAWCAAGTRAPHRPSRPGWRALSRLPGIRIIRSNVEARRRLRRACSNDKGGQVMQALITGGRVTHGCPTRGEAPDIFQAYDMAVSSCSLRPLTPFWLLR